MSQQTGDKRVVIDRFEGVNLQSPPGSISDFEMVACENFNLTPQGALVRRTGMPDLIDAGGSATLLLAHFQAPGFDQVLFKHGNDLYKFQGGVSTLVGTYGDMTCAVQYGNHLYIVRSNDDLLDWNGTTITVITTSPPGTTVVVYKDRMFIGNSNDTNPGRLFFSEAADFSTAGWNGGSTFFDMNPGDGDTLTGLAIIHDNLIVFKMRSSWFLNVVADVTGWSQRNAAPDIGCVAHHTIRQYEGFIYFVSTLGAYRTDGYTFECISDKVASVFLQQESTNVKANLSAAGLWDDKYIVLLRTVTRDSLGADVVTYRIMVYHMKVNGWTEWVTQVQIFNFLELPGAVGLRGLLISSRFTDGKIYRYGRASYVPESVFSTSEFDFLDGDSAAYISSFTTKDYNFGDVGLAKRSKLVQLEYQGSVINIIPFVNGSLTATTGGVGPAISSGERTVGRFGPVGWFSSIQLEVTAQSSGDSDSCFIYSLIFSYKASSKPFIHS